jgi:hypothetical protein
MSIKASAILCHALPVLIMMDDHTIIRLAQQAAKDELAIAVFTVNELARFADLCFDAQTKAPYAPRGVMVYEYTANGVDLVCHLEYEKAERGSLFEPGYSESLTLESAYHLGENIAPLLCDSVVEEIEDAALAQIQETRDDY